MPGPTKRKEKKPKETKFELVKRSGANPLSWIGKDYKKTPESEVRRYREARPGYKGRKTKSTETKLEKDYQKQAFIEKRMKGSQAKKDTEKQKTKLKDIFGGQFERRYQKKGRTGYQVGGTVNTGRENLLEEEGRIDAERMDPNRRAEKRRVVGELNRGFAEGGSPYAKARKRKPSGRLNVDDLKRAAKGAAKRKGMSPGVGSFKKRRKTLSGMLTPDMKKMMKKHREMFKKMKESRKKLGPHQEAKHPKLRHILDQPRKKKAISPHRKQSALEKLMGDASQYMPNKRKIVKKNFGGSMGGGMNPMGWSPDPTVRSVTGYDGGGKVAGRLATRGYGKARR